MNGIIETKNLTKSYGKARGIIDVSICVKEGEIFGFIGPNGAGKSTLIRTLLSLIYKDSGEATIFGLDCHSNRVEILEEVGYLPSEVFYYENMKAIDLLLYSASFYKNRDCLKRIDELAKILELDLHRKIEDMSLGNKKKVGIIQGLLHSPKLIILDEPTSGLDPLMQRTFFEIMEEERRRGATILFSSHILSEVQRICDRVAIIKDGRIVETQKISELQEKAYKKVIMTCMNTISSFTLEGATNIHIEDHVITFMYQGDCNTLLSSVNQFELRNIEINEPSLEEIFMHYYE